MMTIAMELGYLLASLSFIAGLKMMSSPKRAATGNLVAAAGMTVAVAVTIVYIIRQGLGAFPLVLVFSAIAMGTLSGYRLSQSVQMTAMPQLVSLFNAMGGACAMLIGLLEMLSPHNVYATVAEKAVMSTGLVIGAVSMSGSVISFFKLAGLLKDFRKSFIRITGLLVLTCLPLLITALSLDYVSGYVYLGLLAVLAVLYGVLFVLPIGGADMPVVISLLNSFTGVAAGIAGFIYQNKAMLSGGILVGAAGFLLTLLMCRAMNRPLMQVIAGGFGAGSKKQNQQDKKQGNIRETSITDAAMLMAYAENVAIIPGYGLAVAQAQHACRQFEKHLEERGVHVKYIIHPVAGRMPGHMNVLLAEADVSYDQLVEMEDVNDLMSTFDVALVIGANDVVNPAAEKDPDSPVYGMPIIKAYNATEVIVIKRSMNTGYAGIDNDLFTNGNTALLFSDARAALSEMSNVLKNI